MQLKQKGFVLHFFWCVSVVIISNFEISRDNFCHFTEGSWQNALPRTAANLLKTIIIHFENL